MPYWIFVIRDTDEVFAKRMKEKKWPIFIHTHNRKNLKVDDKVVFYKAGDNGQKFLGVAQIGSKLEKATSLDYAVELTDIKIWKKSVHVKKLINNLEFIGDSTSWGRFFQGGVLRISKNDYTLIVSSVISA